MNSKFGELFNKGISTNLITIIVALLLEIARNYSITINMAPSPESVHFLCFIACLLNGFVYIMVRMYHV